GVVEQGARRAFLRVRDDHVGRRVLVERDDGAVGATAGGDGLVGHDRDAVLGDRHRDADEVVRVHDGDVEATVTAAHRRGRRGRQVATTLTTVVRGDQHVRAAGVRAPRLAVVLARAAVVVAPVRADVVERGAHDGVDLEVAGDVRRGHGQREAALARRAAGTA